MLKDYDESQAGLDIKMEDVVNARRMNNNGNDRFYEGDYITDLIPHFNKLSNTGCSMYGNCKGCYASGPVGKVCICSVERQPGSRYGYCVIYRKPGGIGSSPRLIDAEFFSRIMGRGHEMAKADRKVWWIKEPQYTP